MRGKQWGKEESFFIPARRGQGDLRREKLTMKERMRGWGGEGDKKGINC